MVIKRTARGSQTLEATLEHLTKEVDELRSKLAEHLQKYGDPNSTRDDTLIKNQRRFWSPDCIGGRSKAHDSKWSLMKRKLDHATSRQEEVKQRLAQSQLVIPGANTVPMEIWGEILRYCIPNDEFVHWGSNGDPKQYGQVCRQWRNVVLSTPCLWASLSLHVLDAKLAIQQEMLRVWIERSGMLPLSLELLWYPKRLKVQTPSVPQTAWFIENIFGILTPSLERWKKVSLCIPACCISLILGRPLLRLERISFTTLPDRTISIVPSQAPLLRELSVLGVYHNPGVTDMPWSQLTACRINGRMTPAEAITILKECTRLERCRMHIYHHISSLAPLTIPTLRSLWLTFGPNDNPYPAFESFILPSLTELALDNSSALNMTLNPRSLFDFLSRSGCLLNTLYIRGIGSRPGSGMNYINAIPTLSDLQLIESYQNVVTDAEHAILLSRS
ncbi:hypothetical protein BDN72DRAFT_833123 [Pluteus cervinus]|uniref:Uncharacterized protein n=1 Tax=Pluteus cervinus TaxID=181527 RepID=A0ACD3B8H4_9AGAR|nr:hypothetical protein BDN72DRAFT_833123 [Pluteus cervinus]